MVFLVETHYNSKYEHIMSVILQTGPDLSLTTAHFTVTFNVHLFDISLEVDSFNSTLSCSYILSTVVKAHSLLEK